MTAQHQMATGGAGRQVRRWIAVVAVAALAGCGGGGGGGDKTQTTTVQKVKVVRSGGAVGEQRGFDPEGIYKREAPGVVTILSVGDGGLSEGGLGSGFVLNGRGEIVTNAHVVTDGERGDVKKVQRVYVEFSDGNRVPARVRGFDPDADVALLTLDPDGLDLHPLPLGDSDAVRVGEPVAAIGSPFGERQSLSVGIVSAIDRDVDSLTRFSITGAIQTDAAINPGNSGGPLVDADGKVLGLNQQIETDSGASAGVGFAVPVALAKRSIAQLREQGRVDYAYLGVETQAVYPQLAERFDLATDSGAWVQVVTEGGPSQQAGLRGGSGANQEFQAEEVRAGGDVIVRVGARDVSDPSDLSLAVARLSPGQTVPVVVYRHGRRRTLQVKLAKRPDSPGTGG